MTIRSKSIVAIVLTFTCILVTLFMICRFLLLNNLIAIETQNTRQDVERIEKTIGYITTNLAHATADWAYWDDTYNFIQNKDPSYIETNLVESTFTDLELNLILFIDKDGIAVYSKAFDLDLKKEIQVPSEVWTQISEGNTLIKSASSTSETSGFLLVDGFPPILLVSLPILTSDDTGPSQGTLIFGRFFDAKNLDQLSNITSVSISLTTYKDFTSRNGYASINFSAKNENEIIIKPINDDTITGYTVIHDVYKNAGLVLGIELPRSIYHEGQKSITYILISISSVCVVFGLIAVIEAEKQGLSRLKRLANTVERIANSGKISGRISTVGKDEISSLGANINRMLASMQRSEDAISERAEHLQVAVVEAQLANQAKTEFLSGVSHELRTPLTAIIGMAQLLQKKYYGVLNEKQSEYVQDILESSSHLLSLINDVLDLAKIEAGKTKLEMDQYSIRELIGSSVLIVKENAVKKGLHLTVEIAEEILNQNVVVDKRRFRQIMINLMSNSIKFTEPGGKVVVTAAIKRGVLEVGIADTGIGISPEEQEKIFDAFYQVYSGTTGKSPGTGLGLSLAKRLVEQHDGKIWVESEGIGKGSCFSFTISLNLAKQVSEGSEKKALGE